MCSGQPDTYPRLVGDIGGTNARFALLRASGAELENIRVLPCADFPGPAEAIETYLRDAGVRRPRWAALGIANPITGDDVRMTNHHWAFSIEALRCALGLERLVVQNDFTALAMSLEALVPEDLEQIGGGRPEPAAPRALIGAGTGLGISGLVPAGERFVPLSGEGGHITLAAVDKREAEIIAVLNERFPHVSAERVLSGPGLVALHQSVAQINGYPATELVAHEITARGLDGSDPLCRETLDTFCAMLGTVAANLALVLGARGGVYIGGGIVPRFGAYFATSPFRERFEQKGRFSEYVAQIPTYVIRAAYPGLVGAARLLEEPQA